MAAGLRNPLLGQGLHYPRPWDTNTGQFLGGARLLQPTPWVLGVPCSPANSFRAAPWLETLPPSPLSIPPSILGLGSGLQLGVLSTSLSISPFCIIPKSRLRKGSPFSPSLHPTRPPLLSPSAHTHVHSHWSLLHLRSVTEKPMTQRELWSEQTCKGSGSQTMFLGGMRYELPVAAITVTTR